MSFKLWLQRMGACNMAIGKPFGSLLAGALIASGAAIYPASAQESQYEWDGTWGGGSIGWKWVDTDFQGNPNEIAQPPAIADIDGGGVINPANLLSSGTPLSKSGDISMDGITAGGLIGVNRQRGRWVFGLEGAADFANAEDSVTTSLDSVADYDGAATNEIDFINRSETCRNSKDMWFEASLRGRVGILATPGTLLFLTGGLSSAAVEHEVDCLSVSTYFEEGGGVPGEVATNTTRAAGKDDSFEFGWTVGAGAETVLSNGKWRARFDYSYVDLGSNNQTVSISRQTSDADLPNNGPGSTTYSWDETYHKVRFSLVRKFGRPAPAPFK